MISYTILKNFSSKASGFKKVFFAYARLFIVQAREVAHAIFYFGLICTFLPLAVFAIINVPPIFFN